MAGRLHVCRPCARYTLQATCPTCGKSTTTPHPARFSPEDTYGVYRRKLKRLDRGRTGGT